MLDSITWGTYIFFAAFCLLALAFTFFCIPETKGKVRHNDKPDNGHGCMMKLTFSTQTLEDMDLIFGDTAAHEEKERIKHIEAELRGEDREDLKPDNTHAEIVNV